MKKTIFTSMLAAVCAITFTACATLSVSTDYDKGKDFKTMKTFSIYKPANANSSVSSLNYDRIIGAIKTQMKAKGYVEATANPDFMINVNTVVKDEKSVSANTNIYGYGGMMRPYGYWGGGMGATANTQFSVQSYKDGSLIIDMVDAKTNKMFWEGVGNSEIDGPIKNPDQKIADAVAKILATFPSLNAPATK